MTPEIMLVCCVSINLSYGFVLSPLQNVTSPPPRGMGVPSGPSSTLGRFSLFFRRSQTIPRDTLQPPRQGVYGEVFMMIVVFSHHDNSAL